MGDYGEPGGAYEQLERMEFGAEEIRLTTPEERKEGIPLRVELKTIVANGPNRNEAHQRLKDAICRYSFDHFYKTFFQGMRRTAKVRGIFQTYQRILYLEDFPADEVKKQLREFGDNLDGIIEELQRRGLVSQVIRE